MSEPRRIPISSHTITRVSVTRSQVELDQVLEAVLSLLKPTHSEADLLARDLLEAEIKRLRDTGEPTAETPSKS